MVRAAESTALDHGTGAGPARPGLFHFAGGDPSAGLLPRTGETLPQARRPSPRPARSAGSRHPRLRARHSASRCRAPAARVARLSSLVRQRRDWPHLLRNVLPGASVDDALLLAMVAALTAGRSASSTAWLVVAFDFPLRRTLRLGAGAAAGRAVLYRGLCLRRVLPLHRARADRAARRLRLPDARATTGFPTSARLGGAPSCCPRCSTPTSS